MRPSLSVLVLCGVLTGCARKAPPPEDCVEFALLALGLPDVSALELPRVRQSFDRVVNQCLTQPFDREVIACARTRRAPRVCLAEMAARANEAAPPADTRRMFELPRAPSN